MQIKCDYFFSFVGHLQLTICYVNVKTPPSNTLVFIPTFCGVLETKTNFITGKRSILYLHTSELTMALFLSQYISAMLPTLYAMENLGVVFLLYFKLEEKKENASNSQQDYMCT